MDIRTTGSGQDEFNTISLCSGSGGLDLGIRLALPRSRVRCYVESEVYAARILVTGIEKGILDDAPLWSDVHTFDGLPWRGRIHCVSGGYPCQPFSLAGRRLGTTDTRHLWPSIRRIVGEVQPLVCFFENVPGHLSMGFEEVADDLQGMGYTVAAGLFSAEEVGASHRRERLFIMAHAAPELHDRRGDQWERWRSEPANGDVALADAERAERGSNLRGRLHEYDRPDGGWPETERPPERIHRHVADSLGPGPSGRPVLGGDGREFLAAVERVRGDSLVNPESFGRREGRPEHEIRCGGLSATESGSELPDGLPLFPPGPGNIGAWQEILGNHPGLEPAVCRMADGLAHRIDRLRAIGNGVVPLVAAHVWRVLGDAIRD